MWFLRLIGWLGNFFDICGFGPLLRKLCRLNNVVHHLVVKLLEIVVPETFARLGGSNRPEEWWRDLVVAEIFKVFLQILYDFLTAQLHIVVNVAPLFLLELNAAVAAGRLIILLVFNLLHLSLLTAIESFTNEHDADIVSAVDALLQLSVELPEAGLENVHHVDVEEVDWYVSAGALATHRHRRRLAEINTALFSMDPKLLRCGIGNTILVHVELLFVDLLFLQDAVVA